MSRVQQPVDADAVVASRDSLQAALDALATAVKDHGDVIAPENAHARAIASIHQDVIGLRDSFVENRLLRLGVVGQIKTGKSSLLNSLLFRGKEVLPRAATPMTASLTHITKSDRDEIEVVYYTKTDWKEIQEHASKYRQMKGDESRTAPIPDFIKASHQLVEMAAKSGLQVAEYLDTKSVATVPMAEMNDRLTSLVGADGELTPLVKSVTIRCNQGIPDLDIVDTPGMNDPIVSRTRQTKRLLVRCDAVLLLSYAVQFMSEDDMDFLKTVLPQEGIKRRRVIASKFDIALTGAAQDEGEGDLRRAYDETQESIERSAIERLSDDHLQEATHPIFMSTMCSKLATTPFSQWDNAERNIFEKLREAFPDFFDAPVDDVITEETKATLADLGNQKEVEDYLEEVRRDKDQVIFRKNRDVVDAKRCLTAKEIDALLEGLRTYRTKINETDVEEVEEQMRKAVGLEHRLAGLIRNAWHQCMEEEMEPLGKFRRELRVDAKEAREEVSGAVELRTKTKRREKVGFWNGVGRVLGMDRSETVTYEKRVLNVSAVESTIAEMHDGISGRYEDLRDQMFTAADFVPKCHHILGSIVANQIENDIAQDYDFDLLHASLRDAVAKVAESARTEIQKGKSHELPELHLGSKRVDSGLEQAGEAIRAALDHANGWVRRAHERIGRIAQEAEHDLVPMAVDLLKKYQEQLKKDIEDRERKTGRIDSAVREIEQCQARLFDDDALPALPECTG